MCVNLTNFWLKQDYLLFLRVTITIAFYKLENYIDLALDNQVDHYGAFQLPAFF